MWAQLVKSRMKPDSEEEFAQIRDAVLSQVSGREGLTNAFWMRSKSDPQEIYTLIVFESEEKARASERELDSRPTFQTLRSLMVGPPEFVDFDVLDVFSRS